MKRHDHAGVAVENALRILPAAGEPGYPAPGELSTRLGRILRGRLGLCERLTLASGAIQSLDADTAHELAQATIADLSPPMTELDRERQRQTDDWVRYCASRSPYERRRARHG
jgi:hypothetical protein